MPEIRVIYTYGEGDKVDNQLLPKSDTRTPEQVGQDLVNLFNRNIKDTDKERKVVSAEVYNFQKHAHEWVMNTSETKIRNDFDNMVCSTCHATGVRFGFSKHVTPDIGHTHICGKAKEMKLKFK